MNAIDIKQQLIDELNNTQHIITKEKGFVKTTTKRGSKTVIVSDRYKEVEFKTFALDVIDNTPYEIKSYNLVLSNIQQMTLNFGTLHINGKDYDKILSVTSSSNKAVALSLAYGLRDQYSRIFLLPLEEEGKSYIFKKRHVEGKDKSDIKNAMETFLNTSYDDAIKAISMGMIELELKKDISILDIIETFDNKEYIIKNFMKSARGYLKDKSIKIDNKPSLGTIVSRLDGYFMLLNMKKYSDTVGLKRYSQQYYDLIHNIPE